MQFLVRLIVLASVEVLGLHLAGHFSTDEVRGLKRGGGSGGLGRDRRGIRQGATGLEKEVKRVRELGGSTKRDERVSTGE